MDSMDSWLLVTDVDDTLVGDDEALTRFVAATAAAPLLVVLNSSRPIASVLRTVADHGVFPDIAGVIGALGTEIELDGAPAAGWDEQFAGFDPERIAATLDPFDPVPHRAEYQRPRKASFAIDPTRWAAATEALAALRPAVEVITSGDSNFDVIPANAGKGHALRFVAGALEVPMERVVAAGDSENDRDALLAANAVLVGNATVGIRRLMAGHPTFEADGFRADGVLEGLVQYGLPLHEEPVPTRENPVSDKASS